MTTHESKETIEVSIGTFRRLRRMMKDLGYEDMDGVIEVLLEEHFDE